MIMGPLYVHYSFRRANRFYPNIVLVLGAMDLITYTGISVVIALVIRCGL